MAKLRVHNFTVTLDGFAAGVNQRLEAPFGDGVEGLHDWMFAAMEDGATGVDAEYARRWDVNIGATIMGRNMFGPIRGEWADESWKGWWGDNPPYHHDVFVHTHHPRPSFSMEAGTTFHFTDEPVEVVRERALAAAGGKDVCIGGGAATIQQYLRAGLIDELSLVIVPLLAGRGERLFDDVSNIPEHYRVDEVVSTPKPPTPAWSAADPARTASATAELTAPGTRRVAAAARTACATAELVARAAGGLGGTGRGPLRVRWERA